MAPDAQPPLVPRGRTVRILPVWWSPKVWPLILLVAGTTGVAAWARLASDLPADEPVWPWLLLMGAALAWRLRTPVAVIYPGGIAVTVLSAEDEAELGAAWRVRGAEPGEWRVLAASSIVDWRREGLGIRLTLQGSPAPTVSFSLKGIRERDREQIVSWLVRNVGG